MTEKELIRRALLGDSEAQKLCTEKGIVLPCPICHGKIEQSLTGNRFMCKQCGFVFFYTPISGNYGADEYINIVHRFNTRAAPPIGRCKDCEFYTVLGHCKVHSQEPDQYGSGAYVEMLPNDYCSYFKPKEE